MGPEEAAAAERNWGDLVETIDQIYRTNDFTFTELFWKAASNMATQKYDERFYSRIIQSITQHVQEMAQTMASSPPWLFLEQLNAQWFRHTKSVQLLAEIMMYMKSSSSSSHPKPPLHQVRLDLWKQHIMREPNTRDRFVNAVLELVHRERTGKVIDRRLMRSLMEMLLDLDLYEIFGTPFLESTARFYRWTSQQYIGTRSCSDYLTKAVDLLSDEMTRENYYLPQQSKLQVIAIFDREMIGNHMGHLVGMDNNSGLVSLIINKDLNKHLMRMYKFLRRVTGGLELMRERWLTYLMETGSRLVMDAARWEDPVDFAQVLLAWKNKHDGIIQEWLRNDKTFQNAVDSSFEYCINLNTRSPELISLFLDELLRKGFQGVGEEVVEAVLERFMVVFSFLQHKDLFERYYRQHLAKRLLSGRAVADDAEHSFIVKLKTECGNLFTSKLERMLRDMKISKDLMYAFNSSSEGGVNQEPPLAVQVLTPGSWPTPSNGARPCYLPTEILITCVEFQSYYLSMHSGRLLTWQTNLGTADLEVTFRDGRKHELHVSIYQTCILLLFNRAERLSYGDIDQETNIPPEYLKRNLQSLACVRGKNILRKEPMSRDVSDTDVFHFNDRFASRYFRVKICNVVSQKSDPEKQRTSWKVEEDRKPQIDAAVVRIMKSRRVLHHSDLISEVTKQLQARFRPEVASIKRRIEALIDREFLGRDGNARNVYRYLQ
ncbi:unnamed protein product [Calypogeia fissa]